MTLWQAPDVDAAFERAEAEAAEYAELLGYELVDLLVSYELADPPADGAEVWSVMRESWLLPDEFVERMTQGEIS